MGRPKGEENFPERKVFPVGTKGFGAPVPGPPKGENPLAWYSTLWGAPGGFGIPEVWEFL